MLKNWFVDFLSLFYPRICLACGKNLFQHETLICTRCLHQLPLTGFENQSNNPVSRMFWGRVKLENACALYYFSKGSRLRRLVHQLKYFHRPEIGLFLGERMGNLLLGSTLYQNIDFVVPVPLHFSKIKKRGYNQSELLVKGISNKMGIQIDNQSLIRRKASETQTRKTRFKRWENVKEIFDLTEVEKWTGKHILLVDDVITTGATIEACAQIIRQKIPDIKISVVGLACTIH